MAKLVETLNAPEKRRNVVADGARLVEEEVDRRSGLGGLAIKGALKAVTMVRAGFVEQALEKLLPDFAARLEPFYEAREREAPGQPMEQYLSNRAPEVAEALLAITDARAARSNNGAVKGAYDKLRSSARRNVEEAVPGIGRLIDRHVG